jgi:outer membrane protein OmpA-like peptidoglycan-associated protein
VSIDRRRGRGDARIAGRSHQGRGQNRSGASRAVGSDPRSDVRIEIQGHCDERGTEEYNLALGQRRAEAARRYLRDLGISSSRIETKSFGESMPAVRGHGEAAWSKNRRDEFVVVR